MKTGKYQIQYHMMILPAVIILFIFHVLPLFGSVIAFEDYIPPKGIFHSEWVGLQYFSYMLRLPEAWNIFRNTFVIAIAKIICHIAVPVIFALMLNELKSVGYKRTIQTIVYLPHFLSWVVLATPIINIFSYRGVVNNLIELMNGQRIIFLASNKYFRPLLILTDTWKEFGFGTIVYLAAITSINPNLYEAAVIDGASRFQQISHVTLPCMMGMIVLMATRSLGNVLNAGFDQVYNLYSPAVYETADIIDTYVYRVGLLEMNYSLSTAVGLMKSVIGMILIVTSYGLSAKFSDYRIF